MTQRRGKQIKGSKTFTVSVPVDHILDSDGVLSIARITRGRFARFQRERDATEYLFDPASGRDRATFELRT